MAGNSQRRGAIRKSKKGATVGSGGQRRKGLEGKGPTPKAEERTKHVAARRARAAAKRDGSSAGGGQRSGASRGGAPRGGAGSGRRSRTSSEVVAGRNSVVEALRAEVPVTTMYVAGRIDSDDRVREALKIATSRSIPILETPRGELDRLTDALDGITDPRNLGAIIRSVAAFGGHGVVVPERRSAGLTASAWKTSAGAAARVPVALAPNLTRALEEYRKAGFFILGLDMDGEVELPELDLATEPLVIVTGSEGKGLSRLVSETCDQIVSIPMSSAVESLNAGIATGVTLYEIARQRAAKK